MSAEIACARRFLTGKCQSAWIRLLHELKLPDPDDRHVLAAAIAGHADCIVTINLQNFPAAVLGEFGLEAIDPDNFNHQPMGFRPCQCYCRI